MKKGNLIDGNVIDFMTYCDNNEVNSVFSMSEELGQAIQKLIHRLRELGPLPDIKCP